MFFLLTAFVLGVSINLRISEITVTYSFWWTEEVLVSHVFVAWFDQKKITCQETVLVYSLLHISLSFWRAQITSMVSMHGLVYGYWLSSHTNLHASFLGILLLQICWTILTILSSCGSSIWDLKDGGLNQSHLFLESKCVYS